MRSNQRPLRQFHYMVYIQATIINEWIRIMLICTLYTHTADAQSRDFELSGGRVLLKLPARTAWLIDFWSLNHWLLTLLNDNRNVGSHQDSSILDLPLHLRLHSFVVFYDIYIYIYIAVGKTSWKEFINLKSEPAKND